MKRLNITFCSFPDYSGNAKALYEYMKNRYKNNMNYTWIVYNESTMELLEKSGVKSILIGTEEFKKYIPKTDVFFTTQGNLDGDKIKAKNSIYIELWHGVGPKPTGFTQKNPSKEDITGYSSISEVVDYFIVPSDFWKVIYGATFKVEATRIKKLGMPILDYFINSNGLENLEKLLKIKVNNYKKIIMYMPTFKQGFNHSDVINISDNIFNFKTPYDENKLNEFLKKNNYLLCVKKHPGEQANLKFNETDNIKNISEDDLILNQISVNEIINAFDLLITDYSSIGTEFVFLDKPVLFACGDSDEYFENRGILLGNFDFWTPGPISNNISSLLKETKKLLTDTNYYKNERIKYKKLWFDNTKDGGCDKICDFLFDGYNINSNVVRYKSNQLEINREVIELRNIVKEQTTTIKKLTESEIRLKEIENSKSFKILEKIRKIKNRK